MEFSMSAERHPEQPDFSLSESLGLCLQSRVEGMGPRLLFLKERYLNHSLQQIESREMGFYNEGSTIFLSKHCHKEFTYYDSIMQFIQSFHTGGSTFVVPVIFILPLFTSEAAIRNT